MFWIIPILVPIVYGSGYVGAGDYIRILAPMFTIRFISSAMTTGLIVANKQLQELVLQGGFILAALITFSLSLQLPWMAVSVYLYISS